MIIKVVGGLEPMGPIWLWLRRRGGVCSDEYGWPSESCEFPAWLANTTWIDFDSKQLYNVSADVIYELRAATRNAATARPAAPHARQTTTGELRTTHHEHSPPTTHALQTTTGELKCVQLARSTSNELTAHSFAVHGWLVAVSNAQSASSPPAPASVTSSGVNASSRLGGTSLVSRLSACLTEANWWRLIAE